MLSGEIPGPHKIQGMGAGFIPKNCDLSLVNRIMKVNKTQHNKTKQNIIITAVNTHTEC